MTSFLPYPPWYGECNAKSSERTMFCRRSLPTVCMYDAEQTKTCVGNNVQAREAQKKEFHLIQCSQQKQIMRLQEYAVYRKVNWNEIWRWSTSRLRFMKSFHQLQDLVTLNASANYIGKCGEAGTLKTFLFHYSLASNGDRTWSLTSIIGRNKLISTLRKISIESTNWTFHPIRAFW